MPTVNIKTDYGAVGDGQIATVNATFSSASNNLTVFSNIFAAGDVGKYIAVAGWIATSGPNPLGVSGSGAGTVNNTIASISSAWNGTSMTVVLGGPAAGLSVSNVSTNIEWGSNDTPAFAAFNTAQAAQLNVTLLIPAGRYLMISGVSGFGGSSLAIGSTIATLTVTGSGGPTISDFLGGGAGCALGFNGAPLYNDNTAESLIQTVSAGASVLHTITPTDANKYAPNTWAWMTGYDAQGFGSPPSPQWAEFVYITAVDGAAGTVTLSAPLRNSYKSTWPKWVFGSPGVGTPTYTGGAYSLGGPATLYLINSVRWDRTQTWSGVNFLSSTTLFNCGIRDITIDNANFESFGPNCSFNRNFTLTNSHIPSLWELDKDTDYCTIRGCTIRGFYGPQSPSPYNVVLDNCVIEFNFPNTSDRWTITNCTLPSNISFGPSSYGASSSVAFSGTSFAALISPGGAQENDISGVGAWSCTNGLMSRTKNAGTWEPPQFAVPGSYFGLSGRYSFINPVWKCIDIWESGGILYLQTNQSGGFPLGFTGSPILFARAAPPLVSFSGNTGADDAISLSNVGVSHRYGSRWDKTYSGNVGASNTAAHLIAVWGTPTFVRITVNPGYSAGTVALNAFVLSKPGNTEVVWNPIIDLTIPGLRTITTSGVTGTAGADSGLAFPNGGNVWLVDNQIVPAMSGAVGAGSVRIEIQTDQGFSISTIPFVLRLHA